MKDSGIEWIGKIPTNWNIQRLKNISKVYGRIGFRGYTTNDIVSEGEGAITLSPSNINNLKANYQKCTYISWDKYNESPEIMIDNGDIIFVKTGSSYGKSAIIKDLPLNATINPQLIVFKEISIDNDFMLYFLQTSSIKNEVEGVVSGGTIPTMSQEKISNFHICIPPLSEQKSISAYLDRQCRLIDSVIEKTKASIEEYKKLRQAVITQAVTKGVRGERLMKDSGIDAVQTMPSDWQRYAIKHLVSRSITDGTHMTPDYSDYEHGVPFLSSKDISSGVIDWSDIKYITKELHEELYKSVAPQAGDILLAKNGTTGIAAIVEENKIFDIYVTIALIRAKEALVFPKFLLYSVNSLLCKRQFDEQLKGIGVPNLHLGIISNTKVFLPDLNEQKEIAEYLDKKCTEIDTLITKKEQFLTELESYKKSMIYEYVTGKKEVPQS